MLGGQARFGALAFGDIGGRTDPAADVAKRIFERSDLDEHIDELAIAPAVPKFDAAGGCAAFEHLAEGIGNRIDTFGGPRHKRGPGADQLGFGPADHGAESGIDIALASIQIDHGDAGRHRILDRLTEGEFDF